MKVTQIASIMNDVTKEILGTENIVAEDLSNIVDVGKQILDTTDIDNYVHSLVDHVGRVVFVDRRYSGTVPSVLMDAWEYGSIKEKITMDSLPEAEENDTWKLQNGQNYNDRIFYEPQVSAKFFNKEVTFEVPMSFAEKQVKSALSSAEQLNSFISMIYTAIENSMTLKTDALISRTINNFIAETVVNAFNVTAGTTPDYTTAGNVRCINLLKRYNDRFNQTLTADKCLTNPEFIRYASMQISLIKGRLKKMSTLFNIGGKERFTPEDRLTIVSLTDFIKAADSYLNSDTFHDDFVKLPTSDDVPYWQGSGTDYEFGNISKITVKPSSTPAVTIDFSGILCVMFDKEALGVSNFNRRVTSDYVAKAEFVNNYYKMDAGYFNDFNENFVMFYVA